MATDQEKILTEALDDMAGLTAKGMSPTDALIKTAEDRDLGPGLTSTLGTFYNKARAAAVLKRASSDENARHFPVADVSAAVRHTVDKFIPKAKNEGPVLPSEDRGVDKAASDDKDPGTAEEDRYIKGLMRMSDSWLADKCINWHDQYKNASSRLRGELEQAKIKVGDALNEAADRLARMPRREAEKSARLTVNAYGRYGTTMLNTIIARAGKDMEAPVEKTASTAVLPASRFHKAVDDFFTGINKLGDLVSRVEVFEKHAGGPLARIVDEWRGNGYRFPDAEGKSLFYQMTSAGPEEQGKEAGISETLAYGLGRRLANVQPTAKVPLSGREVKLPTGGGMAERMLTTYKKAPDDPEMEMIKAGGPEFYRVMRELQTKENFLNLSLYDKHLSRYPMEELAEAYNEALMMHPTAYRKPGMAKVLMMQYLESRGVVDPHEYREYIRTEQTQEDIEKAEQEGREEAAKVTAPGKVEADEGDKSVIQNKKNKALQKKFKDEREKEKELKSRLKEDKKLSAKEIKDLNQQLKTVKKELGQTDQELGREQQARRKAEANQ